MSVISFTDKEEELLRDVLNEYCDIMCDTEATSKTLDEQMEDGLGSVMYKLYKGRRGQTLYEKYARKKA